MAMPPIPQKTIRFKDLPEWSATRFTMSKFDCGKYEYDIFNPKGELVGRLHSNMMLTLYTSYVHILNESQVFGTNIHQAMRYVFLRTQTPKAR